MEDEAAVTARTRCGWVTFMECGVVGMCVWQEISSKAERS